MGGREEGATGRATLEGPLKTEVHRSHAHVRCVPGDLCEAYSSRLTAWVPARFLYRLLGLDITIEVRESMAAPTASSDATSGFVWPSSQMLADFLEARMCAKDPAALAGRRVLELGGGTGALGMALSARGAEVTITDLAEQVPHIEANLVRNEHLWGHEQRPARRPTVQAHAWGEDIEWLVSSRFDIVIGADLLYFGGWDIMSMDTRVPLMQSLVAAVSCSPPPSERLQNDFASATMHSGVAILTWVVRNPQREEGFIREAARRFHLRLFAASPSDACVQNWQPGQFCEWVEIAVGTDWDARVLGGGESASMNMQGEAIFLCLNMTPLD